VASPVPHNIDRVILDEPEPSILYALKRSIARTADLGFNASENLAFQTDFDINVAFPEWRPFVDLRGNIPPFHLQPLGDLIPESIASGFVSQNLGDFALCGVS